MLQIAVYDMAGKTVGEIELEESIFGITPNKFVLHDVVVNYLANQRQGTHSTLTRGKVSGGGKKPYKQNKIDKSRAGSIRMPQWRHGGIVFGPHPRDYSYHLNKKVKRLAMKSALSAKVRDREFIVVDSIQLETYRTKAVVAMLSALGAEKEALIVTAVPDQIVYKSAHNIPGVMTATVNTLNVYDILNYEKFIISQEAVAMITEMYIDDVKV
jgi:50S ribosomal protein L4, bacterial/organelle